MPGDLQAICLKALNKNPDRRYRSAGALADDLTRWLNGEPTMARPARAPRRTWLWARRNKGWASAIAAVFLTVFFGFLYQRSVAAEQTRESLIQQVLRLRLAAAPIAGWSDEAWGLLREASKIRKDPPLADQAAATLIGLDARNAKTFEFGASFNRF